MTLKSIGQTDKIEWLEMPLKSCKKPRISELSYIIPFRRWCSGDGVLSFSDLVPHPFALRSMQ